LVAYPAGNVVDVESVDDWIVFAIGVQAIPIARVSIIFEDDETMRTG